MKILIDIPDEVVNQARHLQLWPVARAVLELCEPGAGGHCLAVEYPDGQGPPNGYRHQRLGVTVRRIK